MKTYGPLYAKASTGKIKVWKVDVTDTGLLVCTHGYLDGALTTNSKEVVSKNVGRSNQTSPYEQACNDAQSKMNRKMDEGYVLDQSELTGQVLMLPMLANKYSEKKHLVKWPAFASPKLDGNRLVTYLENEVQYRSRNGKEFGADLTHLNKELTEFITEVGISDGELYLHGYALQDIVALSKKTREETKLLEYWIFDVIDTDLSFQKRYDKIKNFFNSKNCIINDQGFRKYGNLVEVPNYEINNEEELQKHHNNFTELGFEGTMIRNKNGLYKLKHRSSDLLKKKDFLEEEFKIIGGKSATGNDIGTVVFICETSEGKSFDVRPKGTREKRREWLNNIESLINKNLTVRFQYFSNDNIPCHLRGICIRDYE